MGEAVHDSAAIAFSEGFYGALAFGRSVQSAFALGRAAIAVGESPEQAEVPQLYAAEGVRPDDLIFGSP